MDTASGSDCSSGGMEHTAVAATHRLPCLHQDSRRLATNQYEICGLGLIKRSHLPDIDRFKVPGIDDTTQKSSLKKHFFVTFFFW
ncbi:MAG: hypothetical protein FJ390_05410 [Verrucomicrobia bacterium]|nr:hypothetical protein [Verrucomicrobiota bacterium]